MTGKYDDDLLPESELSPAVLKSIKKTRDNLRKRTIERGIVQFRADAEFMEALLNLAEQKKVPPGVLCRKWIWERLQNHNENAVSPVRAIAPIISHAANGFFVLDPHESQASIDLPFWLEKTPHDRSITLTVGGVPVYPSNDKAGVSALWTQVPTCQPMQTEKKFVTVRATVIKDLMKNIAELQMEVERTKSE